MADPRPRPNVFSIPAGAPFLPTLADALLSGRLTPLGRSDPLGLADVTILLPTRRAARALHDALIERIGADAAILPAIRPIGDAGEEDHLLDPAIEGNGDRLALPPAISRLARQLALTRLTLAWGKTVRREMLKLAADEPVLIPASPADATKLAADLARLMDDLATSGKGFAEIKGLAADDQTGYFRIILDFLKIAAEAWPAYLAEIGRVDPATRRDLLIRAEAKRLRDHGSRGPIIAAGSTGSIPATAELLKAVAYLQNGAVVLPGLDTELDEAGWSAIGTEEEADAAAWGHPQFGLKHLIAGLGIARQDVEAIGAVPRVLSLRSRVVAEAMRPAQTTDHWSASRDDAVAGEAIGAGLADAALTLARHEQEEALAIALAFRAALEEGVASAALVTPDRTLARRVAAELGRWGIVVDDSAGAPLDRLPAGIFARLLVEAVLTEGDPVKLLVLLKHPLAAFGMTRARCRQAARALELALFRGRRVTGGIAALRPALAAAEAEVKAEGARHIPLARRRLWPSDWALAGRLVDALEAALGPIEAAFAGSAEFSVTEGSTLLIEALCRAARDETGSDDLLWSGEGGAALAGLLTELSEEGADLGLRPAEFPPFLGALMGDVAVPRPAGADPRIHIWGTLEARLQSVDLMILGGLDEGVWPAETRTDPFLSRTMRTAVGLPPPERRIGQAAHDFAAFLAAPRVIVTRALKRGGAPTVESRWLQRLTALIGAGPARELARRGEIWLGLARRLDAVPPDQVAPARRPAPKPAVIHRPRKLSITEIETLIRDPYAIYAKHVLRLRPLDPLGLAPDYALRGTIVHDALGQFVEEWMGPFDAHAEARLLAIGDKLLEAIAAFPDVHAVWSIRFRAIAAWFIGWEAARSGDVEKRHAELKGELDLTAPGGPFVLSGRADRVDLLASGGVAIYDFKTGTPQTDRTVFAGLTPQMTLEAAMVRAGGFGEALKARTVGDLAWLSLGKVERGEPYVSAVKRGETADDLGDRALAMLEGLIAAFDNVDHPYRSRTRPRMERDRYLGDYDHLARVREWALVESAEDVL